MPGYSYYEADLHLLNRKAALRKINGNGPAALRSQPKSTGAVSNRLKKLVSAVNRVAEGLDWEQDLQNTSCVAFDTETTGLKPFEGDEVISIGAIVIENGLVDENMTFYRLVNPGRPQSAKSLELTGLSDEMLKKGCHIYDALADLVEFAGPRAMIAHSAAFDLAFFNLKLGAADSRLANPVIDTALLAAALLPPNSDFTLEGLASRFKVSLEGRHNALEDAIIAARVYLNLFEELKEQNATSLPKLARLLSGLNPQKGYPTVY